jgi:hypothetical protein
VQPIISILYISITFLSVYIRKFEKVFSQMTVDNPSPLRKLRIEEEYEEDHERNLAMLLHQYIDKSYSSVSTHFSANHGAVTIEMLQSERYDDVKKYFHELSDLMLLLQKPDGEGYSEEEKLKENLMMWNRYRLLISQPNRSTSEDRNCTWLKTRGDGYCLFRTMCLLLLNSTRKSSEQPRVHDLFLESNNDDWNAFLSMVEGLRSEIKSHVPSYDASYLVVLRKLEQYAVIREPKRANPLPLPWLEEDYYPPDTIFLNLILKDHAKVKYKVIEDLEMFEPLEMVLPVSIPQSKMSYSACRACLSRRGSISALRLLFFMVPSLSK